MPNPKHPPKPKSTEEMLREMEGMSKGVGSRSETGGAHEGRAANSPGALKSLLGFFIKVVPEEEAQTEAGSGSQPAPPPKQRVADLVAEEPAPKFKTQQPQAGDLSAKPFEEIYKEAGIAASQCSVDELRELLENPAVANQPLNVKVIAVSLTLSAKGIGPDVPIADAVRRDRALDAYQDMLDNRAQATEKSNAAKIQQLTEEVEEYLKRKQVEMENLRAQIAEAKRQVDDFSIRRSDEEKRLAELIAPFLEGKPNPVTFGNQHGEPPTEK
jgi:hypothetical protein